MKKILRSLLIVLVLLAMFPLRVAADMGPKPSVHVSFTNCDEEFYVTLLSRESSFGPYRAYDGDDESNHYYADVDEDIFLKFVEYAESDDYYFMQYVEKCSSSKEFAWTYYPPDDFKVLIYLPSSDSFLETETLSKYAFDSYYLYDFNTNTIKENYDHTGEIISFVARVIATILIEVLVALLFKYKKHLKLIIITNIITQILLNLFVNFVNYTAGLLALTLTIFFAEALVMIIEIIVFRIGIKENKAILYAIVANILSFIAGFYLVLILPGMF